MTSKQELLNQAAREYKSFHEALQGLNEEHLNEVWLGTWNIKDIVAHIAGWQTELAPALERIARGERPVPAGVSYDDVDAWNARFTAARRGAEAAELLLELDESHERFMRLADTVPDARFAPDRTAYKIVDMNSAHHYREHGDQIRAWRTSRSL